MIKIIKRQIGKLFFDYISKKNGVVVNYNYIGKGNILRFVKKITKNIITHLSDNEKVQLYTLSKSVNSLEGNIAEVGVCEGGSAKILSETNREKNIYLFDTFEGLPKQTKEDCRDFQIGEYSCSIEKVKNNLKNCENVFFNKGLIKDTSFRVKDKKFSFVHLDVDLYKSTMDCLEFFYKRMTPGGIILTHDYFPVIKSGVYKAFRDFFKDKRECVLEISDSYGMVVKL